MNHKVRIVIIWDHRRDTQPKKVLVTNRVQWEVVRILKVYRYRWTGTETFHRDGKQELGMGDCQLRSGEGQTRHMYLVMLAYSLLMSQLQQGCAQEWALCRLTTIGESCRAMLRETLRTTIRWAVEQATQKSRDYDPSSTVGVVILGEFGRKSLFFNEWVWFRDGNVLPQLFRIS